MPKTLARIDKEQRSAAHGRPTKLSLAAKLQSSHHRESSHQQAALKATGSAVAGTPPVPVTADQRKAFIQTFEDPKALKEPFLGTIIDMCRDCIAEYQAFKADPARRKQQEDAMAATLAERRTDPAEIRKASAYGVFRARALAEAAVLLPAHMVLSMATLPHAVRARYPDPSATPEELYTPANPVVRRFDELCTICEPYIGAVATFVALAETLGSILDMPSTGVVEQAS